MPRRFGSVVLLEKQRPWGSVRKLITHPTGKTGRRAVFSVWTLIPEIPHGVAICVAGSHSLTSFVTV